QLLAAKDRVPSAAASFDPRADLAPRARCQLLRARHETVLPLRTTRSATGALRRSLQRHPSHRAPRHLFPLGPRTTRMSGGTSRTTRTTLASAGTCRPTGPDTAHLAAERSDGS